MNIWLLSCGLVALVCASTAFGQTWRQLGNFPGVSLRCAYFWDTTRGIVAGTDHIYTYSLGVWSESTYPEASDTVRSIRLIKGALYAATGGTSIWKSTDSGTTWHTTIAHYHDADDIYLDLFDSIRGMNVGGHGMVEGSAVGTLDGIHLVAARDESLRMAYSTDGGVNWASSESDLRRFCGYCLVTDYCAKAFYTITDGDKAELWKSTDNGVSWIFVYDFKAAAVDVLDGGDGVLYALGVKEYGGIQRSTDGGITWDTLEGPSIDGSRTVDDRRMFAFGPNYQDLIVMQDSAVWLWDGPIVPNTTKTTLNIVGSMHIIASCDSVRAHELLWFTPRKCSQEYLVIDSVVAYSGWQRVMRFHHGSFGAIDEGVIDTTFNFAFHKFAPWTDTIFVRVLAHFNGGQKIDTTIMQIVTLQTDLDLALLKPSATIRFCDSLRVPILVNIGQCQVDTCIADTIAVLGQQPIYLHYDGTDSIISLPNSQAGLLFTYIPQTEENRYYHIRLKGHLRPGPGTFDTIVTEHLSAIVPGFPTITNASRINVPFCAPTRYPVIIRGPSCGTWRIDSTRFEDAAGIMALEDTAKLIIPSYGKDTLWFTTQHLPPATYNTKLHVFGSMIENGVAFDTLLPISVNVYLDQTPHRASAPRHITISNCRTSFVPIYLNALPCDSVEFRSCDLSVDKTLSYTSNLSFGRMVAAGASDTLLLTFPPQGLNQTYIFSARFKGAYPGTSLTFDTTVTLQVTFTTANGFLSSDPSTIDLPTISTCDSYDTTFTFSNLGCDTITVTSDQSSWQPDWSVQRLSFPIVLPPDSGFSVRVHYKPSAVGTFNQSVRYAFANATGNSGQSTELAISATAVVSPISTTLSESILTFGTRTRCSPDSSQSITITNTGCDALHLTNTSLLGDGFVLSSFIDTTLQTNESITLRIDFTDSALGDHNSMLHIHGITRIGKLAYDTTVALSATIISGSRIAAIDKHAIDFGTLTMCDTGASTIVLSNSGCDTLLVERLSFANLQISCTDSAVFPLTLPPNKSAALHFVTELDTTGHPSVISDTVWFESNSDQSVQPVTLSARVKYPTRFSLGIDAKPVNAANVVEVDVLRHGTLPPEATQLDFDLVYNEDLLSFVNINEPDVQAIGMTNEALHLVRRSFRMQPASDRARIATLYFYPYLTTTDTTQLLLQNQRFTTSSSTSPDCIAVVDSAQTSGIAFQSTSCAANLLRQVLLEDTIDVTSINVLADRITISYDNKAPAGVQADLFDPLGRCVQTGRSESPLPGLHSLDLPLANIRSGVYYLRCSSGGFVRTRPISILR